MTPPLNFQEMFMTLQRFWADQGCLIWQPYYSQIGAGTMNPATFLRVLGPEPWKVAYVEPSIRPDDARYGENPYRMQMHYQFQVILKPDPGNPQEIYLQSLQALGIDPREHDIRFVEDNWEQPALGAWGLGWEVWLDGQEITQFTYFQQAGGLSLDPVSVEITYGMERIAMPLQRVRNFRDIQWSPTRTDGDVNLQAEQEQSKYYFETADVDRLRQMYALYEAEAKSALAANLVLPAYDNILKCSHTFNVLDTRGAVGVTERQAMFGRMREMARQISEAYLAQRQQQEYPWLDESDQAPRQSGISLKTETKPSAPALVNEHPTTEIPFTNPFLLEIGTEELPAGDLDDALSQLREKVPHWLDELRLEHGEIQILGTPRRLVVSVADLAVRQVDRTVVVKGPPADRAFDKTGQATRAAEGFASSRGLAVADLQVREMDGGRYVVAEVKEPGKAAQVVLASALPGLVGSLRFGKSMRWNSSQVLFSRPIRWLLALYADQVVPFTYAGLQSDRVTRGLRFHDPEEITIQRSQDYFTALSDQGIILDPAQRMESIRAQTTRLAEEIQGKVPEDPALLAEVTNLVEAPTALRGSYAESHLSLPSEVLVSVMKKHQRYFPVLGKAGLLPYFIAVRNGDDFALERVTDGNELVIRARFADAAFFINEDMKLPLSDYVPLLDTLTFQKKLGSMFAKTRRIQRLVEHLGPLLGLNGSEAVYSKRAAELCKADLVTKMTVEMTSLQGVMGRFYARRSGEPDEVAQAIYEHYLPRFAGDQSPNSKIGLVVGIADRLDSLTGLFAAGLAPTGTKDPFAQRRAALGLVQNLIVWDLDFDLRAGIKLAAEVQPVSVDEETQSACLEFITGRLRGYLLDQGYRYDVVDAVLAVQGHNPASTGRAGKELTGWVARPDWAAILPTFARCVRITRDKSEQYPVSPDKFREPGESALYEALLRAEAAPRRPGSVDDFLQAFLPMAPTVNQFFDEVLVMAEQPALRENRLGLLQRISNLSNGVANLGLLEGF